MITYSSAPVLLISILLVLALASYRYSMLQWRSFLDSLDTNGGHIIVLFVLLLIGWRMFQADATAGGSIMTLSSGAILAMMKSDRTANKSDGTSNNADVDRPLPPSPPAPIPVVTTPVMVVAPPIDLVPPIPKEGD